MKNIARITLIALIVALAAAIPVAAFASSTYLEATGGRVNVRSCPGLYGEDLFTLFKGEQVPYLGCSSVDERGITWYKVQYYAYGTGWVSSKYSRLLSNGVSTGNSNSRTNCSYGTVVATGGNSNIRAYPNLNGEVLRTFHKGCSAAYLGSSSTDDRGVRWDYVSYNGTTGWVSSRYTTLY